MNHALYGITVRKDDNQYRRQYRHATRATILIGIENEYVSAVTKNTGPNEAHRETGNMLNLVADLDVG